MRFEAKNHYLKGVVGLNYKNVPKSVATRHQYNMCLNLLSPPGVDTKFLYKGDIIGKGIVIIICIWITFVRPSTEGLVTLVQLLHLSILCTNSAVCLLPIY